MATPTVTNTPVTGGTITIQWKEPGPSYCSFNVVADSGESFYYSLPVAISPPLAGATVWYNVAPGSRIFYISGYPVTETVAPSGNYYLAVTISCTANPGIGWN